MPVIVDTSPLNTATVRYHGRKVLRTSNGTLWVIAHQATDTVPRLRYSTDDGANWSTSSTAFAETVELRNAAWVFCSDGAIYMLYEVADSSEIRVRKGTLNGAHTDIAWSAATTINVAGFQAYFDLAVHEEGGDTIVHVVYADFGTLCEYKRAVWGSAFGSATVLTTWNGGKTPIIEFNHTEADVTAVKDSAPHVYVTWFEDSKIMFRKNVYSSGPSWAWNSARIITSDAKSFASYAMSFDGTDIVMIAESLGTAEALLALSRNAADTSTASLANTPTRNGTATAHIDVTYNPDRDIEVFHSDGTAKVMERCIYDRSGSSWGSWATIDADADDKFPNVKLGYWSGSKVNSVELIWTDGTTSLYDIMHEWFDFPPEAKVGSDSAALTEASVLSAFVPIVGVDAATLSEIKQLVAQLPKADSAALTEVAQFVARVVGVDAASLSEASVLAIIEYISGSLSSTLSEQAVIDIFWQLSDSATLSESAVRDITFLTVSLDLRGSTYLYRTFPPLEAPKVARFGRKFLSRIPINAGVKVYAERVNGVWEVTAHPGTRSPVAGVDWESTDGAVDNDVRVYNGGSLLVLGSAEFQEVSDIADALTAAGYTVVTT